MSPSATVLNQEGNTGDLERAPGYITERWKRAQKDCAPWHNKIVEFRKAYDLDHYDKPPLPNERRINLPDYTNVADLAIGILSKNPIEFRAFGFTPSGSEEGQSSRVEKYLSACLYISTIREEINVEKFHVKQLVRDGCSVLRGLWDPDYHQEFSYLDEETGKICFRDIPFRTQVIDALTLFVVPGGKRRWLSLFQAEDRTVADVEAEYGPLSFARDMSKEQKEATRFPFIDYWEYVTVYDVEQDAEGNDSYLTDDFGQPLLDEQTGEPKMKKKARLAVRNAIVYNDYLLEPLEVKDGYEDIPYTVVFYEPAGTQDPKDWGKGLLTALLAIVPHLETRYNRQTRLVDIYSAMPFVSRTRNAAKRIRTDPGLGKIIQLDLEEELGFPTWPGTAPDVTYQIGFLQNKVQESSFPSAMFGQGVNNLAGYAVAQLIGTGQIRLVTVVDQLAKGWAIWARKAMSLFQSFIGEGHIQVYGVYHGERFAQVVQASDADGIRIDAELRSEIPGQDVQQVALATQSANDLSQWTRLQRYYGVPQPDDEMRRIEIESVKKMPAMQEILVIEHLRDLSKEEGNLPAGEPRIYTALLQKYLAQGVPGQAGRPTEPNKPMQPLGLQSPTGEPYPSAEGEAPFGQGPAASLEDLVSVSPALRGG